MRKKIGALIDTLTLGEMLRRSEMRENLYRETLEKIAFPSDAKARGRLARQLAEAVLVFVETNAGRPVRQESAK